MKHYLDTSSAATPLVRNKSITEQMLNSWYYKYRKCYNVASFDIETTGYDPKTKKIFSFCIGHVDGTSEVWRLDTNNSVKNRAGWRRLKEFFLDTSIAKIAHNYKFELKFLLAKAGITVPPETIWHDTMLMSRMLRNLAPSHRLSYLTWEIGGYEIETPFGVLSSLEIDKKVSKQAEARGGRYDKVDKTLMYWYQIADAERPVLLYLTWIENFKSNLKLYKDYIAEVLTTGVTAHLENVGVTLDWREANNLAEELEQTLENIQARSFAYFKEFINLNSDKKVRRILYRKYGLPVLAKTDSNLPSTDKETLITLSKKFPKYHTPIHLILQTRAYVNALSMLQGYMERADTDGNIYPTINSCQAKTHRQSGENPNMQNVSKGLPDPDKNPYPVLMRRVFKTPAGYFMCLGDYAGIEMRLIIELAESAVMIEAIRQGKSPHVIACELFYGALYKSKKENPNLYQFGKNAHFALGYGAGFKKLANTLGVEPEIGMDGLVRYREEYPEIAFLNRNVGKIIKDQGFIETKFGNKLYVPKQKAYSGLNYLIQCTAAKILKRAEINIHNYCKIHWDNRVQLSMVIHDEVIMKFERGLMSKKDEILYDISRLMCDMPEIEIPLEVEWKKTTSTWQRAKDYDIQVNQKWKDSYEYRMAA